MPPYYQSTHTLFIQAPPEKVYRALANWELRSLWRKGIQMKWEGSSQAYPGQEVTFRIQGGFIGYSFRFKVTGLEPSHRLYMEYLGKPLEGRNAIELIPQKGGCQVAFHWMKVKPKGFLAKTYFWLGLGMRSHRIRSMETLRMLKQHLEETTKTKV
jgi:uncharacterized protein YndB with AHSA1/START domain